MGIVRENIEFQRGLDPKQSMDIGFIHKWINLKKGDLFKIKRDFTTGSDNRLDDSKRYNTFQKGDYLIINDPGQQYEDGNIGFTAFIGTDRVRSNDDKFLWGAPLQFEERLQKVSRIGEAQNFQRGLDSKKSMRIGQSEVIPKDIDWDLNPLEDKFYEFISVAEFIPDWKGIPILVVRVKDKDTKETGYYAVTNTGLGKTNFTVYGPQRALLNIKNNLRYNGKIKESLDFERGQDPKDSMKIGRFGERDIKKTLDRLVEIRGGEYKINYIKDWGNRTPYVEGTYFMAPVYNKVFRADNLFIRYYPAQGTSLDYFTYGYRIEGKVMLEKILTTADEGLKMILSHITVYPHDSANEAQHFQRGLDPMKAMKIGKNFLAYKKGDKVKVWVPWEQRLVEVRVYEDERTDSDGKPKIEKMFSSTRPSWEVRRIWIRYNGEVRTANLAINPENPEQDKWIIHQ